MDVTSCWYDDFYWRPREYLRYWYLDSRIMRLLNSARDFGVGRVPTTYIENHDHAEVVSNAGGRAAWYRTQPHAIALFTTSGAPLVFSGQEFGEDYWMPEMHEETETQKRVVPRPKRRSTLGSDGVAGTLRWLYGKLASIRHAHPALRSPNFYPDVWDESWCRFREGYGVDTETPKKLHRQGAKTILAEGILEYFDVKIVLSNAEC